MAQVSTCAPFPICVHFSRSQVPVITRSQAPWPSKLIFSVVDLLGNAPTEAPASSLRFKESTLNFRVTPRLISRFFDAHRLGVPGLEYVPIPGLRSFFRAPLFISPPPGVTISITPPGWDCTGAIQVFTRSQALAWERPYGSSSFQSEVLT